MNDHVEVRRRRDELVAPSSPLCAEKLVEGELPLSRAFFLFQHKQQKRPTAPPTVTPTFKTVGAGLCAITALAAAPTPDKLPAVSAPWFSRREAQARV